MQSFVLCFAVALLLAAHVAASGLRSALRSDNCFMTHLNNCNDCIADGSHKCGFCWNGRHSVCATVVGDADFPGFHCDNWVKPNLPWRPTVCHRDHIATDSRLAAEKKKASPLENKQIKKSDTIPVVTPGKIQYSKTTVPGMVKRVKEIEVNKESPLEGNGTAVKIEEKAKKSNSPQKSSTPKPASSKPSASKPSPSNHALKKPTKVMPEPVMNKYLREIANDVKYDTDGMQQDKIEYDKMNSERQTSKYQGQPDWRVPIGERERRHIAAYKPQQIKVHYAHKEEVQARKAEIMRENVLEKRKKWEIQDREVGISEDAAVSSPINTGQIVAGERPDHKQFNAYLKEEDEKNAHLSGYKVHGVRMEHEHSRHPNSETEEDSVEPLAATPDELRRITSDFNENQGLESSAAYKHSLQGRRVVKHGFWRR